MQGRRPRRAAVVLTAVIALAAIVAAPAVAAPKGGGGSAPTKPGNLRLTGSTTTTISIAWDASRDNDDFHYEMHLWQDPRVPIVPKTQTTFTWTGLKPSHEYYLSVVAVDVRGNNSFSDLLIVRTPRDFTPPSAPTNLRVDSVGSTEIELSWDAATDDSGIASYSFPGFLMQPTGPTSARLFRLKSETTYSLAVRAVDLGGNAGPLSDPVTATTLARTDFTPPSTPTLWVDGVDNCEVFAQWSGSTDDQDEPSEILYELRVNNFLTESVLGLTRTVAYGNATGDNTFVLQAIDSAGNVSAPSNPVTLQLFC